MNNADTIYSDVDKTGLGYGHSSLSSRSQNSANPAEAADPVDANNADAAAHNSTACAAATSPAATVAAVPQFETGKSLDFEQDHQVSPAMDISPAPECKYTQYIQKYALL